MPFHNQIKLALGFIEKGLDEGLWEDCGSLPSAKKLARIFEVGRPSIIQALRELQRKGRIRILPRGRTRISGFKDQAGPSSISEKKLEHMRLDIGKGSLNSSGLSPFLSRSNPASLPRLLPYCP